MSDRDWRRPWDLKNVERAGWKAVGIADPESVADHSWGVGLLVLLTCPPELDRGRALALAIIHDLPEVLVGDLTPRDGVSPDEKRRREARAARTLFVDHPELLALWEEYAENQSPEARFVHDLDKLEMGVQAERYRRQRGADTSEFLESARADLDAPALLALLGAEATETD